MESLCAREGLQQPEPPGGLQLPVMWASSLIASRRSPALEVFSISARLELGPPPEEHHLLRLLGSLALVFSPRRCRRKETFDSTLYWSAIRGFKAQGDRDNVSCAQQPPDTSASLQRAPWP